MKNRIRKQRRELNIISFEWFRNYRKQLLAEPTEIKIRRKKVTNK